MRLTSFTDYSLRVLMYLGVKDGELATISEIASHYDISRNHIMKVVYELGRCGYVETLRGKHGGMRLAREPSQINIGELVRHTESDMALVECLADDHACCLSPSCVLREVVGEALTAFLDVLDRYSLADLLAPRRELAALLWKGIPIEHSNKPPTRAR